MQIGDILGFSIEPNKDGTDPVLILKCTLTDADDQQGVELFGSSGIDYNPPVNARAAILKIGEAWKIAVGVSDGVTPESLPGEIEIYSTDGTQKLCSVKCAIDGTVTIKGLGGLGQIVIDPLGTISCTGPLGNFALAASTGRFSVNGNFTVDP